MVKLGDITLPVERKDPATRFAETFNYIDISAVDNVSKQLVGNLERKVSEAPSRARQIVRPGDVLVSTVRPALNAVAAVPSDLPNAVASTGFCVLRPLPELLLPAYLFHFVITAPFIQNLVSRQKGGAYPAVTDDDVRSVTISVPPLSEQRRVVEILQEAEAVRRLRADADRKTAELIPALFHEMFLQRAKGGRDSWPHTTVEKAAAQHEGSIRTGPFGSDLKHSEFVGTGIPVLAIDNVVQNRFRWTEPRCVTPEKYRGFTRFRVFPRDVMVTIMGTVGRTCVAPDDLPECMSTKHLCVITPNREVLNPFFLWATVLCDPAIRGQTNAAGRGAIMEGWNANIIRRLRFSLPPMQLQDRFEQIVRSTFAVEDELQPAEAKFDEFSKSLLTHAFAGDLTATWRQRHARQLTEEARQRDEALRAVGTTFVRPPTAPEPELEETEDGRMSELTAEQRRLWKQLPDRPFTAVSLAGDISGPLRSRPDAVRRHLEVFCARGLLLSVKRRRQDSTQRAELAQLYRKPTAAEEGWLAEQMTLLAQSLGGNKP